VVKTQSETPANVWVYMVGAGLEREGSGGGAGRSAHNGWSTIEGCHVRHCFEVIIYFVHN